MTNDNGTNAKAQLEALRKRETALSEQTALREQILSQRIILQRHSERKYWRLAKIIGVCLLDDMDLIPEIEPMVQESLKRHAHLHLAEVVKVRGWRWS